MIANNLYNKEVEPANWQAYEDGHRMGAANPDTENPYRDDTTALKQKVAWDTGRSDVLYTPVEIDWTKLDMTQEAIRMEVFYHTDPITQVRELRLLLKWLGWMADADDKPDWADNRPMDASIPLDKYTTKNVMSYGIRSEISTIELPCPPYKYEAEGADLRITAGTFTKQGTKAEWQEFLDQAQAEVNDLPDGIDIDDVTVSVDVTARAVASWSTSIHATSLLSGHEKLSDEVWLGTMDELHDALVDAVDDVNAGELDAEYAEYNYEVDEYETQVVDLDYDLNDANEL